MSLADNITEQLKSSSLRIVERVRESSSYAQAQDRYENLSPSGQKLVMILGVLVVAFFLLFIPFSNLSSSHSDLSMFEEKRNLIRELFRTYRESSSTQNLAVPPGAEMLKQSIQSILTRAELMPEQIQGVSEGPLEGRLIPQNLVSDVLYVNLSKLNLKQIVDIGASIAGISSSVKMKDLSLRANMQDTRYFDVTYKLYSLKVPEPTPEPPPEPEIKSKKSKDSDVKKEIKESDE